MGKTSIIILTYNQLNYTEQCIESIRTYTKEGTYEIIIVDNHSTDGTVEWLKQQNDLKVIYNDKNLGFPKGCNQGIEIASGDYILLLNNDVIVTENWLNNLLTALESAEDIGAVGPITNSAAYYTSISTSYRNLDEMHEFSRLNNVSEPEKWEERLKLIGFCMLIKRQAVEEIGLLDEQFTPGNFEDDDYSVRLRNSGYRLLLCHDTFIHHYGSVSWKEDINGYSSLLSENEQKFKNKWGTTSYSYVIHTDIVSHILSDTNYENQKELNILHVGSQSGGTLLKLKSFYKNAKLYGVEENNFAVKEANQFASVENDYRSGLYPHHFFDVIILTNSSINKQLLKDLTDKLKPSGSLYIKVPNLGHIGLVAQILSGNNPFNHNSQEYYGLSQLKELLKQLNLSYKIESLKSPLQDNAQKVISGFQQLFGDDTANLLEITNFLIKCKPLNSDILTMIKDVYVDNKLDRVKDLNKIELKDVFETLEYIENPIEILQKVAITNFSEGNHEMVLPYLQKAYELDQNNPDTIFNIAFVLKTYGDLELAHQYLDSLIEKDEENINLQQEIKRELEKKDNELVFLLRRFEFDIDLEETKIEFITKLSQGEFTEDKILLKVQNSIIDKIKVFHAISICCFEHNLFDYVLPFLNKAYELDNFHYDTLYNLAYVLYVFDEKHAALNYLNRIEDKDERVEDLIHLIKGGLNHE